MIVIRNGTVLTLDDADTVHFGGTVVLDGDRIARVAPAGESVSSRRRPGDRRDRQDRHAGPDRPALPHGAGQGLERPPAAVGVPADLLVPDDPRARPRARPTGRRWPATPSRSAAASPRSTTCTASSTRWPSAAGDIGIRAVLCNDVATDEHDLDTLADNAAAYRANHGTARRPRAGARRHRVAAAGLDGAAARRAGAGRRAGHRHPHPPQRVARRGGDLQEAVRPPPDRGRPTTPASWAPTASPRTACGCRTPRSR